jgi:hypothetical protein
MLRWAAIGVLASCGTEPDDRPILASYAGSYDPARLISATVNCDRLVSHVVLELGNEGVFELSINVVDDCTRAGGGFAFSEVYRLGTYARQGSALAFTPDGENTPAFSGTLEPTAIVLVLFPGVNGLSSPDAELRVPRIVSTPVP